jgi:ribonuclease BN (tRNA processing enzyme)
VKVKSMVRSVLAAVLLAAFASGAVAKDEPASLVPTWTTLGTAGGPVTFAERSQPANLLSAGNDRIVVDCGDGCTERLAGAGVSPVAVRTVVISHLHQDHVAGLYGLISLRWMMGAPTAITIYGPPGIEELVDGINRSLVPSEKIGLPSGAPSPLALSDMVKVVVVNDGADFTVGGVRVRAVRNSHFDEKGQPAANGSVSLSYRFDASGRAIGYTGDTGPSDAVTRLFTGVGLIVSEAADLRGAEAAINAPNSPVPPAARAGLVRHIAEHHLTPAQAGAMAAAAGARCLVLTHLSISVPTAVGAPALEADARSKFAGSVSVARDLDRFVTPLPEARSPSDCAAR